MCALIGTATNQDGRSASLTAPNGPAQQQVIKRPGLGKGYLQAIYRLFKAIDKLFKALYQGFKAIYQLFKAF